MSVKLADHLANLGLQRIGTPAVGTLILLGFGVYFGSLSVRIVLRIRRLSQSRSKLASTPEDHSLTKADSRIGSCPPAPKSRSAAPLPGAQRYWEEWDAKRLVLRYEALTARCAILPFRH